MTPKPAAASPATDWLAIFRDAKARRFSVLLKRHSITEDVLIAAKVVGMEITEDGFNSLRFRAALTKQPAM